MFFNIYVSVTSLLPKYSYFKLSAAFKVFAHYPFFCAPSFPFHPHCYWLCLFWCTNPFWTCRSCATLGSELTAFSSSVNIFQIYFYCYLHFRVGDKDICKRILRSAVHLLERSLELAGLHRHCHGVSSGIIHNPFILTINLIYTLHERWYNHPRNIQFKSSTLNKCPHSVLWEFFCAHCNNEQIKKQLILSFSTFQ